MKACFYFLSLCICAGCATRGANYSPTVDLQNKDQAAYYQDLYDCRKFAENTVGPGGGAIGGAVFGGLFMALLAPSGYKNDWARSGAMVGTAGGAVGAGDNQETIIKRCLMGRGYSVLN